MNAKAIEKVFEGVNNHEQIVDALRRRDASYIRGVIQCHQRYPTNPFLVKFLQRAIQSLPGGASPRC